MEEWISLREFARRREVTLGAVQKAIESKRVTAVRRSESGRLLAIEYHAATAQWNSNTDPDQAARAGQAAAAANSAAVVASPAQSPLGGVDIAGERTSGEAPPGRNNPAAPSDDEHGYLGHRAKREEFQAKRAELDYLERVGVLVSAAQVQAEQFDIFRQHRDKLEQIPANLSERLAAETDPQRVEHLLRTAIRNTLNELSRGLALDAAAEGAAERTSVTA